MHGYLFLDPEQNALFCQLVEAFRSVPRAERRAFMLSKTMSHTSLIHPGLPGGLEVYEGDMDALLEAGLLRVRFGGRGTPNYDITQPGFAHYAEVQMEVVSPVAAVEDAVTRSVDASGFANQYPQAHASWQRARELLGGGETAASMTEVGHHCREALQFFAESLVQRYGGDAGGDPAKTVSRIRSTLNRRAEGVSSAVKAHLDALLALWGTTSDLVQRQEHGALKEGDGLEWEDARRVLYQTAIVMYEVDRVCRVSK